MAWCTVLLGLYVSLDIPILISSLLLTSSAIIFKEIICVIYVYIIYVNLHMYIYIYKKKEKERSITPLPF